MTTRSDAQAKHERFKSLVMRTYLDWCGNVFSVNNGVTSFCTASGEPCYQTYGSCKDKANFVKTSKVRQCCLRGMKIPPGETIRPYIIGSPSYTPPELPLGGGLAVRSNITVVQADEACPDVEDDPYISTRSTPAQGTYQTRLLARNYNYQTRIAELLDGYVTDPWDWSVFQTSKFLIDQIAGPDADGNITYTLSDLTKILDSSMLPAAVTGKLQDDLKAIEYIGYVAAADATHLTLPSDASAIDDAYKGEEFYISQNTSAGERRVCIAYVGETRTAEFAVAWSVVPDTTSVVEVSALSVNVGTGNGSQYKDPAVTGEPEFICIGKEEIQYTAITGDVISWPDSTYRAKWGTARADASAGDGVSQVLAFVDKSASYVLQYLFNNGGMADGYLDLVGLDSEDSTWLGNACRITASIASKPEQVSGLVDEFLKVLVMGSWWDPVASLQRFKCDMPNLPGVNKSITPDETIGKSMNVTNLDSERITQMALHFAPYSATNPMTDDTNFSITEDFDDANAESANEYNGVIQKQLYSRWLTAGNAVYARAFVGRQIGRLRDAPFTFEFNLDPRDEVAMADLIDVNSRKKTDLTGAPLTVEMRVTKLFQDGNYQVKAINTAFAGRPAFIAPDGTPDYPADTIYAHISDATGKFSDGTDGHTII